MKKTKRILSIFLAVLLLTLSVPLAFAEGDDCQQSNMRHYDEGGRSSTINGEPYICIEHWECEDCWRRFADSAATQELTWEQVYSIPCPHNNMRHYDEGGRSSTINGEPCICIEHWECEDCHTCFSDAAATQELTWEQVYIPCPHSNMRHYDEGDRSSFYNGNYYLCIEHWWCEDCYTYFSDAAATQELTWEQVYTIPCLHNSLKHYEEGKRSDYNGYLNVEFWQCEDCHAYFNDAAATQELTYDQIYTIPCPHARLYYERSVAPKCGENGSVAHWYCRDCHLYFADAEATQVLTYDEVYSVAPEYEEHEYLYDLSFEESADRCWLSLGLMGLEIQYYYGVDEPSIDRQNGTITGLDFEGGYTEFTFSFKYCAHCGAYVEAHYVVKDQNGNIVSEYQDVFGMSTDDGMMYLHQPGPVENDLVGYTEMPTSSDGLAYGGEYFDLDAFLQDAFQDAFDEADFESEEEAEEEAAILNITKAYIATAKVYFNADKSSCKMVLSDDFIIDDYILSELDIDVADYIKTNTDICAHVWDDGVVTTPATCTQAGVKTFTCTLCGDTKTQVILATGHNWNNGVVTTNATCTEAGVKTFTCTNCGNTKTQNIPATGHSWDAGVVTKEATCTQAGVKTFTCTNCGSTRTQNIPVTAHSWDEGMVTKVATDTETGICTYTCTKCGTTRTEVIPKLAPTELLEEIGQKQSLEDTSDDGTVYFDESANLPADTVFDFEVLEKTDWYEIFDLKLTSGGEEVEPDTPVWVRIPVPAGWEPEGITVWHGWEQLPSFVENGYIYFYTSHFSEFQFKYEEQNQDDNPTTPTTPDATANACKWCGKVHEGFFQKIIAFFHNILARIFGARY